MIDGLVVALWVACGALALYGLALTAASRPVGRPVLLAVGFVVGLLLLQAVLVVIALVGGAPVADPTEIIIYLAVAAGVLPFVTQFARAEPNRWGGAIVAAGAVAVGVAVWRLQGLWVPVA